MECQQAPPSNPSNNSNSMFGPGYIYAPCLDQDMELGDLLYMLTSIMLPHLDEDRALVLQTLSSRVKVCAFEQKLLKSQTHTPSITSAVDQERELSAIPLQASSKTQTQDSQMGQVPLCQDGGLTRRGQTTQHVSSMNVHKIPNSKEQEVRSMPSVPCGKQEPFVQAPQLYLPFSSTPLAPAGGRQTNAELCAKTSVSGSMEPQSENAMLVCTHVSSTTTPLEPQSTTPQSHSIGQEKPFDAADTIPPVTSQKQKVSGALPDLNIPYLSELSAATGGNLQGYSMCELAFSNDKRIITFGDNNQKRKRLVVETDSVEKKHGFDDNSQKKRRVEVEMESEEKKYEQNRMVPIFSMRRNSGRFFLVEYKDLSVFNSYEELFAHLIVLQYGALAAPTRGLAANYSYRTPVMIGDDLDVGSVQWLSLTSAGRLKDRVLLIAWLEFVVTCRVIMVSAFPRDYHDSVFVAIDRLPSVLCGVPPFPS